MKAFDAKGAFAPVAPGGGDQLRQHAVRSAGVTLVSGGIVLAIQVVATVVLARLLAPRDFGLIAMVTTFSVLFLNFGLNGFTEAIVQRDEIDHDLASTLFWINLGAGFLLTIGFAASGSLLAWFYHDPQVARVAAGVSLTIVATSFSVIHLALLKRAMRFSAVSINDICARAVSVLVSTLLGLAGWGVWALVIGAIALPLSAAIGAWYLCRWLPGRPKPVAGTGSMLRFALNTYGRFSVNYFSRNSDNLLVGWRFDAQALGFYKKAYDLFALTANQLVSSTTVVAVSALSRVRRDADQYRRYLLGAIAVMTFIGMGLSADLTLVGKDLIRILLGPGWEPAGQIFSYFGPGIGVMVLYCTHGWIHLSIGRADRWFRWGILEFLVTFLLFLIGLPWGPVGIACAWTASFWILVIPALWYAGKPIDIGIGVLLRVVWRYMAASVLAGSLSYLVVCKIVFLAAASGVDGAVLRIVVVSALVSLLYLSFVVMLYGGLQPLRQMASLVAEMLRARTTLATLPVTAAENASNKPGTSMPKSSKEPLVSILIPAYNSEEWIAETIRSAMEQTWPNKEIIVVDDGSTDRTLEIARRFESDSIQVVTQTNQGASAARNMAYSLSQGDYIQWLDADDLLVPDKITFQMDVIGKHGSKRTLLSGPWGMFMYRPWRANFIPTALWCDLSPVEWLHRKMERNIYMQTATWLVSRELTEIAGPWDTRLLGDDDGEYFCRILLASDGVRFVRDAKVCYRSFGYNSLGYVGLSDRKCEAHWLSMQLHIGYLRSMDDSARSRAACLRYLRNCLIYFYPEKVEIVKQAQEIAREMGKELGEPVLSWKYAWVRAIFGWSSAKRFQVHSRKFRWQIAKIVDRYVAQIESKVFKVGANRIGDHRPGVSEAALVDPVLLADSAMRTRGGD